MMPGASNVEAYGIDIRRMTSVLWRRKVIILVPMIIGVALAWLIHSQITLRYAAEATILLNLRTTKVIEGSDVVSSLPREQVAVRTEMDVLRSRSMAERVVDRLRLVDDAGFLDRHFAEKPLAAFLRNLQVQVKTWWREVWSGAPAVDRGVPPADRRQILTDVLQWGVVVNNDGESFTLHVRFDSPDPKIGATVANGYAEAYLDYQREIKTQGLREANRWLGLRTQELRSDLDRSDGALDRLRRETGKLFEGGLSTATQEIVELNHEMLAGQAEQRDLEGRLIAVREAISRQALESSPEILSSVVISGLRHQQAAARALEAEMLGTYGERHPALASARSNRAAIDGQIAAEATRIAASLEQGAEAAAARVASLQGSLKEVKERMAAAQNVDVQVTRLEREANAERSLYESYLTRMKQLGEREQLETPDAVVITAAQISWDAYPKRFSTLLLGLFGGGLVGSLLGFVRERLDDSLRTADEIERLLDVPVLGLVPDDSVWRQRPEDGLLRRPNSAFAEAVRATSLVMTLADDQRPTRVIAVTSALPGEGKTTLCVSLTRQLAFEGRRVLLIDADFRRPRVNAILGGEAGPDLLDLLLGRCSRDEAIRTDKVTEAHFLGLDAAVNHPTLLLQSSAWRGLLSQVRHSYDVVLIDTSPVTVATDTAVAARGADACLFFVRWGVTSRESVLQGVRLLSLCRVPVTGVILGRVSTRQSHVYADYPASAHVMAPATGTPAGRAE